MFVGEYRTAPTTIIGELLWIVYETERMRTTNKFPLIEIRTSNNISSGNCGIDLPG
jgi:hypothetical protein